jgi:hypothetical protein
MSDVHKIPFEYITMLCKLYPNDQDLGKQIRKRYNEANWEIHFDKASKGRSKD